MGKTITRAEFESLKKKFNNMKSDKQWLWIIENKEIISRIDLDNDETYILFSLSDGLEDEDYINPQSYLGNSDGVRGLLHAIGIKNDMV